VILQAATVALAPVTALPAAADALDALEAAQRSSQVHSTWNRPQPSLRAAPTPISRPITGDRSLISIRLRLCPFVEQSLDASGEIGYLRRRDGVLPALVSERSDDGGKLFDEHVGAHHFG
jgi:hypothetical protein